MEIYTVGGGPILFDIFNYLAALTTSKNFRVLISAAITAGVFVGALQMVVTQSASAVSKYLLGTMLAVGLCVGVKTKVTVMDTTVPLGVYGVVDNVPWSVALVGSLTSRAGHYLTRNMETLLAAPSDLTYQKSGMMFGASILSQASTWRAVTPVMQETLVNYLENCMVDGANIGIVDTGGMTRSGDLNGFIASYAPQSLAFYDPVLDATVTCRSGWSAIQKRLNAEVQALLFKKAAAKYHDAGFANATAEVNLLKNTLNQFQTFVGVTSSTAVGTIKQAMLVNALDSAVQRLIAGSGNNAAMTSYQAARTEAQTRSSYNAVGISALRWVPLLKITFEALYYAAFPLAVIMMMTPLVWTVIKGYFGGFLWLAAWSPLSAILQSIVLKSSAGYYRDAMGSYDGATLSYVLNFANQFGVRAVEQDVGAIAGYLMMSVPFIATVILFGAGRVAGLATSMLNVSQGAAIETGREAATGNIQLANASMNNFAANKWNTSHLRDTGLSSIRLPGGAMAHVNADGSQTFSSGTAQSSSGMNVKLGASLRSEISERKDAAIRRANSERQDYSEALSNASSYYTQFASQLADTTTASSGRSVNTSSQAQTEARTTFSEIESFAKQHGISTDAAYKMGLSLGIKGAGNGGGVGADFAGVDRESFSRIATAAKDSGLAETVSKHRQAVDTISNSNSSSQSSSEGEGERWSYDTLEREARQYGSALEEVQTLTQAETSTYARGLDYDRALGTAVENEWRQMGYSEAEIARLTNPKSLQDFNEQEEALNRVMPKVIQDLGLNQPSRDLSSGFRLTAPPRLSQQNAPRMSDGQTHRDRYDRNMETFEGASTGQAAQLEARRAATESAYAGTRDAVEQGQTQGAVGGLGAKVIDQGSDLKDGLVDLWGAGAQIFNLWRSGYSASSAQNIGGGSGFRGALETTQIAMSSGGGYAKQVPLSAYDRDIMIRTIAGEAGRESWQGKAAVAHVILNRVADARWSNSAAEVSLQPQQFSAWNKGVGGNSIPNAIQPGSQLYEEIGTIVDLVSSGRIADPTGGATHYYAPKGMEAHVAAGEQSNLLPNWLEGESYRRQAPNVTIGGHVFTGRVKGTSGSAV
ncbi:conjugal transfer protein TraG N-terminal domain-containing protein [Chachezhania sediminis]|uniref:conjugal transfer protein TraG N-terminal domain-containing protein n=1 Tax=Chachezhania sediminis TaxID=2599291 RepID=UPI00131CD5EB|nr:conjugal transfer protein TraG N-terminal domain-containing protein [Chachezhania sediminis]